MTVQVNHMVEFQQLLARLLSPDNDVRKLAEEAYDQIEKNQRASLLFLTAKSQECNVENRQMALVLLRRLLSNEWEELWKSWAPEVQTGFRNELLSVCQIEQNETLRKRFCDLIAEVARNHLDETNHQTWPEVLKFLFDCTKSDAPHFKEIALMIFENVPGIFGEQQDHYLGVIKEMLQASLQFNGSLTVKVAAVKAATSFLVDNEGNNQTLKYFQPIVPDIIKVAVEATELEEDDTPLECLTDLVGSVHKLFRPHLTDLCTFCLKTVSDTNKEEGYRHSALEVLVSLGDSAAAMMRKEAGRFIPDIIQQCLGLMVEVEDEENWDISDEPEEEDTESSAAIGETSLDRLACSLGGKSVLNPTLRLIQPMLHQQNWKHRYAALLALSTIGEGCHKQMELVLESVLEGILPFLNDSHPRVRYAACNSLGQMSSDFAPTLQKKFHQKVIPALLSVLENLSSPRVAAHAGAALVNFSEDAPKHVVVSYLDPMMRKLEWVLQQTMKQAMEQGKKLVLEQIITTIASVADTAEEAFKLYYDSVMPHLKFILQHAVAPNLKLMRGKTIECISLIGLAVGKDKFLPDANEVMQLLLKAQTEMGEIEVDDPQLSYMISAWTRICRIMGKDFQQYLPLVMPAVMKTASFKPEVTILESEDAEHLENEEDWEFVNLGDQQSFGIKTSGLEDKATACQMLVCYARELKGAFADYVEEVTKLMVPLLKFYFHDGVRSAAAESLPYLLESAKEKGPQFVADMWKYIFPELLKAIELDPESDVLSEHLWALAKSIEFLGAGCLTEQELLDIIKVLEKHLMKHFEKASEREEARKDEDYDEETEKELEGEHEEDTYLLSKISDVFHALFATHKENILPYFDMLLQYFVKLIETNRTTAERQWAICLFDDVIEFGGVGSTKYQQYFLAPMLHALEDSQPEVRQAAAYGFGVMGMYGGNVYAQACTQSIPFLAKMISHPDARKTEANTAATENAVSAVAKILKYNSSMVDTNQVLPTFISWLPIWEDDDECPHVYGYFCDLIEANNPVVVGESHANLPHLVKIMAETFSRNSFEASTEDADVFKGTADAMPQVARRMCNIIRHIQVNGPLFEACLSQLTDEQKESLQIALAKF